MNHIRTAFDRCSLGRSSLLLAALIGAWPTAAARDRSRISQLQAIFAPFESERAPGAAVLVVKDGKVIFERGYGVRDLRSHYPIEASTNFRLASLTKQFTAMAIMLLIHDGKLRYEDRLTDIFPDFPDYGGAITIRNLLNHTSGLADYEDLMKHRDFNSPAGTFSQINDSQVLELLRRQKATQFSPGR